MVAEFMALHTAFIKGVAGAFGEKTPEKKRFGSRIRR